MSVSNPGICLTWPDHLISPELVFLEMYWLNWMDINGVDGAFEQCQYFNALSFLKSISKIM